MALITPLEGASPLAAVLAHRPSLQARYQAFYDSFWQQQRVPPRVLELCRLRIAQIHACQPELARREDATAVGEAELLALSEGRKAIFSDAERTALALAEMLPFGHHEINDQQVRAAADSFGNDGCVALLSALAFFDVNCRLQQAWGVG